MPSMVIALRSTTRIFLLTAMVIAAPFLITKPLPATTPSSPVPLRDTPLGKES